MSKSSSKKNSFGNKDYKLIHQILCITSVDFQRRTLHGYVELHILPLVPVLSRIKINCKQCRVYRVCVKGSGLDTWLEAAFLNEATPNVCSDSRKRNLDYFNNCVQKSVLQTEASNNGGEITVRLPSETMPLVEERKKLRLSIEFVLDKPSSGIHFVVPSGEGSPVDRQCHMFSYKWGNSSRLWFPCIDSPSEVCTWKIEVTAETGMVIVCPGELAEKVYTPDEKRVTYHFTLATPTSASNIGIAVGPFEVVVDQEMNDVTYFVLPGLKELVKSSTTCLAEAFEFFEESLNTAYAYSAFKLVFVNEAYQNQQTFTSMGILNTSLLHGGNSIEQPFETRRHIVQCIAEQYFGMFVAMHSWADIWLFYGISRYLTGLFLKRMFGNNEYRDWLRKELDILCDYEIDGPGIPPLYPFSLALDKMKENKQEHKSSSALLHLQQHPHLISYQQHCILEKKSHLIMRMIELRIGQDLLLQAFNKVLSLASSGSSKCSDFLNWNNMLLSTSGFLRTISTVSGKDINLFLDKWLCNHGVAKFTASFSFNRKRNIVELEITQYNGKGCQKYVGPLIVCIQELDGSFSHTVQVEDIVSHHELPCHSKSRRNKKKKIPLVTGEEVDMDLNATFDSDSPVLWLRIDPDMTWPRKISLQQPDYMWQYQLRYERDIISQIEAVEALSKYPCPGTRAALLDIINQNEAFYKVRIEACTSLAKVCSAEAEVWDGEAIMIDTFEKMFGSNACPSIPKFNDFSNFVSYFIQKNLIFALSSIRNVHSQCSNKVISFLVNLLKHNDNRYNQFSDGAYVSELIRSLSNTIGPAMELASSVEITSRSCLPINEDIKDILSVVNRRLNMEQILPSFKYAVTCSCLKTIRCLQVNGHIPAESAFFKVYSRYGLFEDIRFTAIELIVDFVSVHDSEKDFEWLLDMIDNEPVPRIRHHILQCLITKPPFTKKSPSSRMNNQALVERLWQLMNYESANDFLLRCDLISFYNILWGGTTPNCVSTHGVGVVIDLKEKRAQANSSFHLQRSPEFFLNASEEPSTKRSKHSVAASPANMELFDSKPGTPMSINSEISLSSKIKLKIKLGDENSHDSGSEIIPSTDSHSMSSQPNTQQQFDPDGSAKKMKKKKKKKHKHKDKKERNKFDLSSAPIPGIKIESLDDRLGANNSPPQSTMNTSNTIEMKEEIVTDWVPDYSLDEEFTETTVKYEISDVEMSPHATTHHQSPPTFNHQPIVTEFMEDDDSDISI